jgi:hypothetical protein
MSINVCPAEIVKFVGMKPWRTKWVQVCIRVTK